MKKLAGLIIVLALFLISAVPVSASECTIRKVERWGRVRMRIVCDNPTTPVNIDETATSTDGSATSRIIIRISGGGSSYVSVFTRISTW